MMTQMSRDGLDDDRETLIFGPRRGTVRVHDARVPSLFNRYGVEQRQWDHRARCGMAPIRYLPRLLERAEKDRRNVVVDGYGEDDAPAEDAS